MNMRQSLLAALILAPINNAFAAPAPVTVPEDTLLLLATRAPETIIVTATRTPQPPAKVGSSVTIIQNAQIVRSQSSPVVDLLRDVPSVSFTRNGGVGSQTSVRIRGAESDQTVLLIDGIKLNDPSGPGGGFDFGGLLVGDIERIEVLRGPQSTLYGSQALGGVINLITRSGDVPFAASLDVEAGGLSTKRARGGVRGKIGELSYSGALSRFETGGISAAASGTERDSFTNTGAQVRLNYVVSPAFGVEARALWSDSDTGIDGFPPPLFSFTDTPERSKTENLILYVGGTLSLLEGRSRTRIGVSKTITDRLNTNPSSSVVTTFDANGTNQGYELQSVLDLTPNVQIVAGGEIEEARIRTASPSSFNPNPTPFRAQTQLGALYIQGQISPTPWLTASLGARQTTNDRFGDALNVRATVAASFNDGTTIVRGAIGDGFKAPTLFQTFSDFGNVTLLPEEAASTEIGLEQSFFARRIVTSITAFKRNTINQIDFIPCFANPVAICVNRPFGTYNNIAKTKADGIEVSFEAKPIERLSLSAGYSTLDARNDVAGSSNFNRRLARRAKVTSFVSVGYLFDFGLDISASVSQIGDSFDNASDSARLKGYELITLRASQKIGEAWTLYGRVENASDASYQTVAGYGSPPRQTFVGLRASF